jgi:hypothetical protein
MSNYIYNLTETEITELLPKIKQKLKYNEEFPTPKDKHEHGIYAEFMNQIRAYTISQIFIPKDTFIEDFCYTIKISHLDLVKKTWPNSVVSSQEDSGGFICKINVLSFLSITEADFKDYLDNKKILSQICKYFKIQRYIKLN